MYIKIQKVFLPISFLAVAASIISLFTHNEACADPLSKDSVPLLEQIGREYAANRERIRTWRGKIEFSQKLGKVGTESLQEDEKMMIRFVYDGEKQRSLSVQKQTWLPDQTKELRLEARMLKDDGDYIYYSYAPEHFPKGFLSVLIIKSPSEDRQSSAIMRPGEFRPLAMSRPPGNDVSAHVLAYAKLLKEGKDLEKGRTLSRTGNIVKLRIELSNLNNEYAFNLDLASSLVEYDSTGSDPSLVWKCKMQKVAGIFIPEILTIDEVRGKERKIQEMRWFDQAVNEPISDDEFTITNMGVHRGDRVQDDRTGARYRLTDEQFPPRTTPSIARELRQTTKRPPYLFIVGLFFLAVAVVFFIYRRYRNAKARG